MNTPTPTGPAGVPPDGEGPPPPGQAPPRTPEPGDFDDFATPTPGPDARLSPPGVHPAPRPHPPPRAAPRVKRRGASRTGSRGSPRARRRGVVRAGLIAGVLGLSALVAAGVPLAQRSDGSSRSAAADAPGGTPSDPPGAPRLELRPATDRGSVVELSWRSSVPMDFAVVVAVEGERARIHFARQVTRYQVPVHPVRRYCFRVQGSDGTRVVQSEVRSIRGATCVS